MPDEVKRCKWLEHNQKPNDVYIKYHDEEWGVPVYNDRLLFEYLVLEGAQAGLSWSTILNKRNNYKSAYNNFDPKIVSKYDEHKKLELLQDSGIVRNKLKILSSITNARAFMDVQNEFGSFDKYIWSFTNHQTIHNTSRNPSYMPITTIESDNMSKDLKRRGFKFVGSTICYSFMQAIGMVNDHDLDCFRYNEIKNTGN